MHFADARIRVYGLIKLSRAHGNFRTSRSFVRSKWMEGRRDRSTIGIDWLSRGGRGYRLSK